MLTDKVKSGLAKAGIYSGGVQNAMENKTKSKNENSAVSKQNSAVLFILYIKVSWMSL
jgi:hypothetical protein